jgi:hypothetical protein
MSDGMLDFGDFLKNPAMEEVQRRARAGAARAAADGRRRVFVKAGADVWVLPADLPAYREFLTRLWKTTGGPDGSAGAGDGTLVLTRFTAWPKKKGVVMHAEWAEYEVVERDDVQPPPDDPNGPPLPPYVRRGGSAPTPSTPSTPPEAEAEVEVDEDTEVVSPDGASGLSLGGML